MPDAKYPKQLTFTTELIGEKLLIRCKENNDIEAAGTPYTIGNFILKLHGIFVNIKED